MTDPSRLKRAMRVVWVISAAATAVCMVWGPRDHGTRMTIAASCIGAPLALLGVFGVVTGILLSMGSIRPCPDAGLYGPLQLVMGVCLLFLCASLFAALQSVLGSPYQVATRLCMGACLVTFLVALVVAWHARKIGKLPPLRQGKRHDGDA